MGYLLSWLSLSKSTAETGLNVSESLLVLCGLVLAFGAAGEYIEEHGTLPRWMAWSRRPKLVFVWMVAISLMGEFIGDAGVFLFSGTMQNIQDQEANDLRRRIEREIDARLAIEKRLMAMGPRSTLLYGSSREKFVGHLLAFAGQKAELRICDLIPKNLFRPRASDETMQLAMILQYVLSHDAKWSVSQLADDNCNGGGVMLSVSHSAPQNTLDAVKALIEALNELPILTIGPAEITPRPPQPHVFDNDTKQEVHFAPPGTDTLVITVLAHPL